MIQKKLDNRIKILVENCVKTHQRSIFVVCGPNARDRVVSLFYILQKTSQKNVPQVLWCYNKKLGFKSDKNSRLKELEKKLGREGALEDPFHLFLSVTNIKYCYFKDTTRVLGNTFDMLIIQEFNGITPNVLARTVETVSGGGIIVILLNEISSLKQLYTMSMDVHTRFRKNYKNNNVVVPRFNERFLLSLITCKNCLVVSDTLSILPVSSNFSEIKKIISESEKIISEDQKKFAEIKKKVAEINPINRIVEICKTFDQANSVITFTEALSEKTLQTTIALTAGRGRGKSACLGLVISLAIVHGYSNIFVTSPTPENVKTLFDFVLKGLNVLDYKDKEDFEIVVSSNIKFNKSIVRINVFKNHRQTIQYVEPTDFTKIQQAELLVIDEAAAIPLPIVKNLLGSYLIFISSTINGYEGTGRSLSLKLINNLKRKRSLGKSNVTSRAFKELKLEVPIRYSHGDEVEKWLNNLLCLNATSEIPKTNNTLPHPDNCVLYYVNRDSLFSFHKETEQFLHNMISLFVASHYKNSPDDLQLMSDSPEHHLFVLLGPIDENSSSLPSIFCAIQVAAEGAINKGIVQEYLSEGRTGSGDLIPWTISKYFQESEFSELSGIRIVRIATHSQYQRMGYGSKAMELLLKYYKGEIYNLNESNDMQDEGEEDDEEKDVRKKDDDEVMKDGDENEELIVPRGKKDLPPLLESLEDRKNEKIDYVGVSFGITSQLYNFWTKFNFKPVYIRLSTNKITGEHSSIMLNELHGDKFVSIFNEDFKKRFISLLSYEFSKFSVELTLNVLRFNAQDRSYNNLTIEEFEICYSQFDLKRLNYYSKNFSDYRIILDLIPVTCKLFFLRKIPVQLSVVDAAVFVGVGFQKKSFIQISKEFNLKIAQVLSIFNNTMIRIVTFLNEVYKKKLERDGNKEKEEVEIEEEEEEEEGEDEDEGIIGRKRKVEEIDPGYPDNLKKLKKED